MATSQRRFTASDPIADLLTRIRNACKADHESLTLPSAKAKVAIVKVLESEGFISGFEIIEESPQPLLRIDLKYDEERRPAISGLKRISKPGLRIYTGSTNIQRVMGGVGASVMSTSQGMMTGSQAYRRRLGGEVICHIW
ncbi:MAG TPA: 30S ribosomal protein S8 [Chloroflexota bacterium]|nr:30S ribosomal protein S8 [Chloroflexota bacterium]